MKNQTLTDESQPLLRQCVESLAFGLGEHCQRRLQALEVTTRFVEVQLSAAGLCPTRQTFVADGRPSHVVSAEVPGSPATAPPGTILVTAHFDASLTFPPTGDDVLSVAALLGLAAAVARRPLTSPVRFVACINHEGRCFWWRERPWTTRAKSLRAATNLYAHFCKEQGDDIRLALSIHGLGAGVLPTDLQDARDQREPPRLRFVGDFAQWRRARQMARDYSRATGLPASWGVPSILCPTVETSDHLAYSRHGYPALAVTTGRPFASTMTRPIHHVDYRSLATYVWGLELALEMALESTRTQTTG